MIRLENSSYNILDLENFKPNNPLEIEIVMKISVRKSLLIILIIKIKLEV